MSNDNKILEALASKMQSKAERDAFAEIIVEYVQPNRMVEGLVSNLLTTRTLKPGDSLVKKIRKGIQVRTLVPGAVHLASEITVADRMNYVLDGADVKVTYNEWEMLKGEIGTVADIRNEMNGKLRDFYINKVYSALGTVWSAVNTPNNYTSVGGTITASALEDAIDRINQTTSGAKAIVGSKAAVTPITKFGAFWSDGVNTDGSQTAIDEIRMTGKLGKYYGVPIIAVTQVYDRPDTYNKMVPEDKILVIGENVGEFILYGDVMSKQWSDMNPTPPQWMLEIYQQFGMIIDNAQGIYVLDDLS